MKKKLFSPANVSVDFYIFHRYFPRDINYVQLFQNNIQEQLEWNRYFGIEKKGKVSENQDSIRVKRQFRRPCRVQMKFLYSILKFR